jgi:hypothetical protein
MDPTALVYCYDWLSSELSKDFPNSKLSRLQYGTFSETFHVLKEAQLQFYPTPIWLGTHWSVVDYYYSNVRARGGGKLRSNFPTEREWVYNFANTEHRKWHIFQSKNGSELVVEIWTLIRSLRNFFFSVGNQKKIFHNFNTTTHAYGGLKNIIFEFFFTRERSSKGLLFTLLFFLLLFLFLLFHNVCKTVWLSEELLVDDDFLDDLYKCWFIIHFSRLNALSDV